MNKISYTTLACPEWDIAKIIAVARENRYDGIDFRGYLGSVDIDTDEHFKGRSLKEIVARVADSGLEVSCLSGSAKMTAADEKSRIQSLDSVKRFAELCNAFNCRQIRMFGGGSKGIADPVANAAETLVQVSAVGVDADVQVAVETHDDWTDSSLLRKAFECAGWPENTGFLWDVHHPFRFHGEKPEDTVKNLGEKLLNTHWKDSLQPEGGALALKLCGEGDVPLAASYRALLAAGYTGWITFEWEKKWHPEIEEPEIAVPQFARFIESLRKIEI